MTNNKSRPFTVYILVLLVFFQGFSGILGGLTLVIDPTGETLQLPLRWLENSPFHDYLIPGLFLLTVLGILPLLVSYGLWQKLSWAWFAAFLVGVILIIWIGVEILIIGYHAQPPLQLIYGLVGLLIIIMVRVPPVRKFFANENKQIPPK